MADFFANFGTYASNFQTQVGLAFERLTARDWLRLLVIFGGYLLIRPRLLFFVGQQQAKQQADEDTRAQAEAEAKAKLGPNQLRGLELPENTDDEDDGEEKSKGKGKGKVEWGKKARRRQRRVLKQLIEADAKRAQEEDSDTDEELKEFLIQDE